MTRDRRPSEQPEPELEPATPMEGPDTFMAHTLRALRVTLNEQTSLTRELLYVLRDVRDELVMMRKRNENGGAGL